MTQARRARRRNDDGADVIAKLRAGEPVTYSRGAHQKIIGAVYFGDLGDDPLTGDALVRASALLSEWAPRR